MIVYIEQLMIYNMVSKDPNKPSTYPSIFEDPIIEAYILGERIFNYKNYEKIESTFNLYYQNTIVTITSPMIDIKQNLKIKVITNEKNIELKFPLKFITTKSETIPEIIPLINEQLPIYE